MDKMTPEERVTFARGKIKSNLDDLRITLDHQRRDVLNGRQMWIVTVCSTSLLLVSAFLYHGLQNLQDAVFDVAIIASFVVVHVMSWHIINSQIMFTDLLTALYGDLVNSETLRFGVEDMAAEK